MLFRYDGSTSKSMSVVIRSVVSSDSKPHIRSSEQRSRMVLNICWISSSVNPEAEVIRTAIRPQGLISCLAKCVRISAQRSVPVSADNLHTENNFVVLSPIIVKISSRSKDITVCFISFFLQIYRSDMPNDSSADKNKFLIIRFCPFDTCVAIRHKYILFLRNKKSITCVVIRHGCFC